MTGSVSIQNVSKSFRDNGTVDRVLTNLSLTFAGGSFTTIVGPNGCGKTTLLNIVAGLVIPDEGSVNIVTATGEPARIGYIWQDYRASLLPWMNVGENIAFPLRIRGASRRERKLAAANTLSSFSTDINITDRIYSLSGGQQQLVCLLRSNVANPDVLLLDEPLSALDQFTRWTMAFKIEEFWMRNKIPTIFVSHDVDEAVMLADEIILMGRDGGSLYERVVNSLPRPRNKRMLTASDHIRCREQIIDFLFQQGAIRDHEASNQHNLIS